MSARTALSPEVRNLIEGAIVGSPLGRSMGMKLQDVAPDRAEVRLPFQPGLVTVGNIVHGGSVCSLIDVAATAAAWASSTLEPGTRGTTVSLTVNFLKPGRGTDLVAAASVTQRGGTLCVCDVSVRDADQAELARALVTYKLSSRRQVSVSGNPRPAELAIPQ